MCDRASKDAPQVLTRCGAECYLETGATAIARHTPYLTAVVLRDLANQGETKANPAIATLAHTGGTIEGCKDPFPLPFWDAWPAVGNTEMCSRRAEGYH